MCYQAKTRGAMSESEQHLKMMKYPHRLSLSSIAACCLSFLQYISHSLSLTLPGQLEASASFNRFVCATQYALQVGRYMMCLLCHNT